MVTRSAGTAQVAMDPIEEAVAKRLTVSRRIGQPIDQSRLGGLTRESLLEHFIARSIPSGHPHCRIVRETVEVILVFAPQCQGINPLSQEFGGRVTNFLGMARIVDLFGQRFDESQSVIGLPQQHGAGMRSDSLLGCLDFDGPVEFRLE
jgi:hypothetical protein